MPIPRSQTKYEGLSMIASAAALRQQTTGRLYPCDLHDECPYGDPGSRTYFCRDNCGLGVDEDSIEDY